MYFYRTQSAHQTCVVSKSLAAQLLSGSARQNWGIAAIALLLFCAPLAHGQANVTGTWQTLPTLMPINPIHTALLSNGKILVVSGSGNYTAQTTYLDNERNQVDIRRRRMDASVLLVKALGGGWTASQLPTLDELTHSSTGR